MNFELSESTVKIDSKPSSEKSDNFEEIDDLSSNESITTEKTAADFDSNLPETVTLHICEETGAKLYLVGTAHFSQESKDDVVKVMRAVQPHIVVLELCDARIEILSLDEETILREAKNINFDNIMHTMKKNGVYYGITYLLLLNLSAHLTKEIGMAPGGEFRVAFKEAKQIPNCFIQLGDRPIKTTVLRALAKLSWFQRIKLAWHLLFTNDPVSKEDVEKCKKRDMVEQLLAEMSDEYPTLGEVFVKERDIYLTYTLQQACKIQRSFIQGLKPDEAIRVVGVVGMGHALGISRLFPHDQSMHLKEVTEIPPPTLTSKIVSFSFKATLLTMGGYFIYRRLPLSVTSGAAHGFEKLVSNIKAIQF